MKMYTAIYQRLDSKCYMINFSNTTYRSAVKAAKDACPTSCWLITVVETSKIINPIVKHY